MKGGVLRFRGKGFSFLMIVLVCTTILMWTWERAPFLATTIPPKDPLKLPSEMVVENPTVSKLHSELELDARGDTRLAGSNTEGNYYSMGNSVQKEGTSPEVEETEAKETQFLEVGNDSDETSKIVKREEVENNQNIGGTKSTAEMQISNLVAAEASANTSSADTSSAELEQDNMNSTILMEENQECDYAKGKWVIDTKRPLYSGFGCKQWLAPMWACRMMQRKDFSYESLRWQPKYCEMEEFGGSKFLNSLRHKTLAFVGDSLGRQQFQSMMCMITGGKERGDVIDVGREFGLVKPKGGVRPNGWAYRFPSTNTTVLYYWSACLCDLEPINVTNLATEYAMHLDRPPAFLRQYLHKIDVLVLNTGHHWNRGKLNSNRWVMYVGGQRNTNKKLAMIGDARNFTIHSIVNWVNTQLPKYPHLKAFYRSISPRHFVNGDWNTGGSCDNTTPMSVGKELLQDGSSDYSAGSAVKGTGVKLLDITALSQLRDEGHISRYSLTAARGVHDCLHWCLPGVPDTWNEILFAQISAKPTVQHG